MDSGPWAVPTRRIYRIAASVAFLSATLALAVVAYVQPYLGTVVSYVAVPLLVTLVAWMLVWILRLRLVGFLPSDPNHLIPAALRPWIRSWLLVRFGLLFGWLILIVAIVVAAVAGFGLAYCVNALVYLVLFRGFLDLLFSTAINVGVITGRANGA